ncbi:MAG TPA: MarR family transcriptional regulator [Croceibacterium sp.]|nr:MarR family transcriptional regulator [Croceibacterium sp.]
MPTERTRKTRLQHKRGPKPADRPAQAPPGRPVEGLLYGGFSVDHSDRHLDNYHRFDPASEADDLYFKLTRALVVAARRWRKVANDRLRPLDQTMAQWETLYLVAYSGEELNQSQLSRLLGVHGPTMLRMLDQLARRGLIERQQSHHDLRVTNNRITPAGREVIRRIMGMTNALRREALDGIDPDELRIAGKVLVQMLRALERVDHEAARAAPGAAAIDDPA